MTNDIHRKVRVHIYSIACGDMERADKDKAISDTLDKYMAYCEANGIPIDDYTLERAEIARGA